MLIMKGGMAATDDSYVYKNNFIKGPMFCYDNILLAKPNSTWGGWGVWVWMREGVGNCWRKADGLEKEVWKKGVGVSYHVM
jgi:hypothetical protein